MVKSIVIMIPLFLGMLSLVGIGYLMWNFPKISIIIILLLLLRLLFSWRVE